MARYRSRGRKSRSSGRRRSGGRRRGSSGRYVASGGGGGGSKISPMTWGLIAAGGLAAFYFWHKSQGVHPAVHAAAMAQQPAPDPNAAIDAGAAAGDQTDFDSATNIGLPIPYNPGAGTQNNPLQM
jgi:hypothetical protein